MTTTPEIPKGYRMNSQGHLVPLSTISDIDKARDKLVMSLIPKVIAQRDALIEFKQNAFDIADAFVQQSADEYGVKIGGKKGNVTLYSFDGQYKIEVSVNQVKAFDERLQVAKSMIDECLHRWVKGSRKEVKSLVERAFKTDKQGNISVSDVLSLRHIETDDEQWKKAMDAIADSIQTIKTKRYIRFYHRVAESNKWTPLSLDIATL